MTIIKFNILRVQYMRYKTFFYIALSLMHACLNAEVNECDSRTALTYRLTLNRRFLYCVSSGAYILHMRIPTAGDPLFRPDASSSKFEIANPERSSDNFKSIGSRVFLRCTVSVSQLERLPVTESDLQAVC